MYRDPGVFYHHHIIHTCGYLVKWWFPFCCIYLCKSFSIVFSSIHKLEKVMCMQKSEQMGFQLKCKYGFDFYILARAHQMCFKFGFHYKSAQSKGWLDGDVDVLLLER
jgi:hypothetical protein